MSLITGNNGVFKLVYQPQEVAALGKCPGGSQKKKELDSRFLL